MDTESLTQKLLEFRTLLEQIQQDLPFSASQEDLARAELNQHFASLLKPIQEFLQIDQNGAELSAAPCAAARNLSSQVLDIQHRLLDDSLQQIMLLHEILQNSPVGLAVISGPSLTFRLANTTYRSFLPEPSG